MLLLRLLWLLWPGGWRECDRVLLPLLLGGLESVAISSPLELPLALVVLVARGKAKSFLLLLLSLAPPPRL